MLRPLLALALALVLVPAGGDAKDLRRAKDRARAERIEDSLRNLGPKERMVQLCDLVAMRRIRKERPEFRPDRAVADAVVPTVVDANRVTAAGGAFRSDRKWYALSYTCTVAPEDMKVLSFSYRIGAEIPQKKWAGYGLWE
ncbi:MAG: DUF930 domain-containing protein [Pseudolabrys sp.]|nr:DUF930 domain-containing protein [Pseudolabrys sp.]